MTYEEALMSVLTYCIEECGMFESCKGERQACCEANVIRALKKQIPQKPRKFDENYKSFSFDCPECGGCLVSEIDGELCAGQRYKYCHRCGQAIDWSDE